MTSWCDKLASTPAVGVFLDRSHFSSSDTLDSLAPLLNKLGGDHEDGFQVTNQQPFSVDIATDKGLIYSINPRQVSVEFKHRLRVKHSSGSVPVVEMLSAPQPYTKLTPEVTGALLEVSSLLFPSGGRLIKRIGLVSTTKVTQEDAPPGVRRLIDYVGAPWKGLLPFYEINVSSQLSDEEKWSDRCIHHLTRAEADGTIMTIRLDYQRTFKDQRKVSTLGEVLKPMIQVALAYFEDVAEGKRFHDNSSQ